MSGADTTDWKLIGLAVGAGMIAASHVGKLPPALPGMRAELDMGLVVGGWVVSAFSVTGMVAGLLAGTLADRIGHWRLTLVGLVALATASAIGAGAMGEGLLLLTRVFEGFGFISVAVSAPSVIARAAAVRDRRLALGVWGTYMPAGTALMMVVAPLILQASGWRVLWLTAAVGAALWFALMLTAGRPRLATFGAGSSSFAGNLRSTMAVPGPWLLALCFGLYTIPWLALMVWLPSFMIEQRGLSTGVAAALTALAVALNVPGNLMAGWLLHRGARHWSLITLAAAVMGLCCVGIFSDAVPDGFRYLLCLVFSGFGGMLPTAVLSGAPVFSPSPAQVGTTNGLLVQGSNSGQVIGPPALAAVVQFSGSWEASVWVMVVACALGVATAVFALRPVERQRLKRS